jgi:hypothetical protein
MLISCGSESGAEVSDLVFHLGGVGDRVRDFITQQTSVSQPHATQLLFHGGLGYPQSG